ELVAPCAAPEDRPGCLVDAVTIADEDQAGARPQQAPGALEGTGQGLLLRSRRMIPIAPGAQHLQHAATTTTRLDFVLDAAAKSDGTDAISIRTCHPCEQGGNARRLHALEAYARAKVHARVE